MFYFSEKANRSVNEIKSFDKKCPTNGNIKYNVDNFFSRGAVLVDEVINDQNHSSNFTIQYTGNINSVKATKRSIKYWKKVLYLYHQGNES